MNTAWRFATEHADEDTVVRMFVQRPDMICHSGQTALLRAAEKGQDKLVAQLLAHNPDLIDAVTENGWTALHLAAEAGNDKVVSQLLARRPELVDVVSYSDWTALHCAAEKGHDKIVGQLLAQRPELIDAVIRCGYTALHCAAEAGHGKIVTRLLAHSPELVDAVDLCRRTALHCAVVRGHEKVAELLLEAEPEQVYDVDPKGNTLLHHILGTNKPWSDVFIEKVARMNTTALRAVNRDARTPFHFAVHHNSRAVELLRHQLSFDEIEKAFQTIRQVLDTERLLRPVIVEQCACLLLTLNRDVYRVIMEYLGFECGKTPQRLFLLNNY